MTYVDGFVLSVKKDKLDAYKKIASDACTVWMEHGALDYKECALDDNESAEKHNMVQFPQLAKSAADEIVVFAYIVFKSREHRDEVNAKVMKDPRMQQNMENKEMPFDCSQMAYAGFKTIVEA